MSYLLSVGVIGLVVWILARLGKREEQDDPGPAVQGDLERWRKPRATFDRRTAIIDPELIQKTPRVFSRQPPRGGGAAGEMKYEFGYTDAAGNATQRRVSVRSIDAIGEIVYVAAFCELRGEIRTFRADRMRGLVNAETGEIIDDPVSLFGSMDMTMAAAGADHRAAMSRARPGLLVLAWIAAADGDTSEAETEILIGWLRFRAGRQEDGINMISARFYIDGLRPTFGDCLAAMTRMGKGERAEFVRFANKMTEANGGIDPAAIRRMQRLADGSRGQ